ncbi:Phosphatidylglycerophosphatase A [uncultured Candidatus Thioglobus sp.]|nr:Phosphatidylglycerophosphatase A [uncultured Candidatus Thioglobus sp.]
MNKATDIPSGFLKNPIHFIAFGFGAGCLPKCPGTFGTLVGIPLYVLLVYLPWYIYLIIVIVFFLLGVWLCDVTDKHLGTHDHSGIVWDEIVGFLIAMFLVPFDWRFLLLGFILFRLFDIFKPYPIAWLDRTIEGGLGIMLDDVLAGIYALVMIQIIIYLI